MNIDELIEKSKSMPNISDGGSCAYSFGDYILVRYDGHNKYGKARDMEEKVAVAANNKNEKGVHTPKHIAIKRIIDAGMNYCYVLQEKAKGVSFTNYALGHKPTEEQIMKQQELVEAPQEHFDKLATDYVELFNMGLEPKAKNVFYDKDYGFTLIDLLRYDENGANLESLRDIGHLKMLMECISNQTLIWDSDNLYPELIKKSKELFYKLQAKIYLALKKIVPSKYRRFLLRMFNDEELKYFREAGILQEDLSLTIDEQIAISVLLNDLVADCFKKVSTGEFELWQIELNEIRNGISGMGLISSYKYYLDGPIKRENFEREYDFESAIQDFLINICLNNFYDLVLNDTSDNKYILKAKEEIEKKKATK